MLTRGKQLSSKFYIHTYARAADGGTLKITKSYNVQSLAVQFESLLIIFIFAIVSIHSNITKNNLKPAPIK